MRKLLAPLPLVLLMACVSGSIGNKGHDVELLTGDEADSTTDFDVDIEQATTPMAMPAAVPGTIDVKYAITIVNQTAEPVQLQRIDLQSIGGERMQVDVSTRKFDKVIAAGAKAVVDYWATARVQDATIGASTPIVIRTRLHLKAGEAQRQESFTRRVNGHFAAGVGG